MVASSLELALGVALEPLLAKLEGLEDSDAPGVLEGASVVA